MTRNETVSDRKLDGCDKNELLVCARCVIEQLKSFAIAIVRLTVLEQRILEILRVEAFYGESGEIAGIRHRSGVI